MVKKKSRKQTAKAVSLPPPPKRETYDPNIILNRDPYDEEAAKEYEMLENKKIEAREHFVKKPKSIPRLASFIMKIGLLWEVLILCSQAYLMFMVSFVACFSHFDERRWKIVTILDSLYFFDTLMRLIVEHWRDCRKVPYLLFPVRYASNLVFLDALSLIPLESIFGLYFDEQIREDTDAKFLNYINFCYFNRVFRVFRGRRLFYELSQELRWDERGVFVCRSLYDYSILIHILACVVYLLCGQTYVDWGLCQAQGTVDNWKTGCWIAHRDEKPSFGLIPDPMDLYLLSLEFVVATMTTVGYGDVYPLSTLDQFIAILIMIFGSVVTSGDITSHLTSFLLEHDEARFDLFFRLEGILEFLNDQESHPLHLIKIQEFYHAMWNFREGVFDVNLARLPSTMQEDLYFDICKEMMNKAIMFKGIGDVFFRAMARSCKICLFTPGMVILRPGIHPDAMYYLIHGEVRVRSRYKEEHIACILRPGSIFGEFGLIIGFPSMVQIETHSVCQVLKLSNEDLLVLFEKFPQVQEIVRTRINIRGASISVHNVVVGSGAVTWAQQVDTDELEEHDSYSVIRSGKFPNFIVTRDVLDDTKDTFICETRLKDQALEKNHVLAYNDTVIPTIYSFEETWIKVWNAFVLCYCGIYCLVGPYCFAFDTPDRKDDYIFCEIMIIGFPLFVLVNFADFMAEIMLAAPVTGFYHQFWNGLQLKHRAPQFWLDILAFLPMDPFVSSQIPFILRAVCKFPKIFRFLSYLDNVYPLNLAVVRLMKSVIVMTYGIHFIACTLFWVACPLGYDEDDDRCYDNTWMDSYAIDNDAPESSGKIIRREFPYIVSLHFSTATLTSVGEGDFTPRRPAEYMWCVFFMIVGQFLTGYCTAALTSGLSCGVRPKLTFNQRLLAMRQFMEHNGLSEQLQSRVVEHYTLQHQLAKGVSLPPGQSHLLYDAPDYIAEDALYLEVEIFLEGIPIFTKAEPKLLARVGRKLKRYMIPPQITFLFQGEVRRQMYIIVKGSVAMLGPDMMVPVAIYESTAHFGIRDMLYGVPSEYNVRTLSYCLLFSLEYNDFLEACDGEKELMALIDSLKHQFQAPDADGIPRNFRAHAKTTDEYVHESPSWVPSPKEPEDEAEEAEGEYEDFEATYDGLRFPKIFRRCLMRSTIHPAGKFAKVWTCWMGICSVFTVTSLFVELLIGYRHPGFRVLLIFLDMLHWMDIFVKMHWAYYQPNNILVSHPVKTAIKYIWDGTFVYDVLMIAPFELFIPLFQGSNLFGYGMGSMWYTKLRWSRLLVIYKFPELIKIARNVFENRVAVLFTLYCSTTMVIITLLSTVAVYLSCPIFATNWEEGNEYKLPVCLDHTWTQAQERPLITLWAKWLTGMYYVLQIMLTVGYGDLVTLTFKELVFLVILTIFGFLIVQATIADMTAAQVDSDEIRAAFSERTQCVVKLLELENVPQKLQRSVKRHLLNTWKKSKGLQPRSLFGDLHPVLESDLFRELAVEQLRVVSIFRHFNATVMNTLCQFIRKEYYCKGQRLSRVGNLEFEMFVIASGKVFMADKRNFWCCTLHKKDFFGEASLLFGTPRTHSAFAATAVEAFVLGADEFALLLDRYPSVRDDVISALGDVTSERFEKKVHRLKKRNRTKFDERCENISKEIKDFCRVNEILLTTDYDPDDSLPLWRRMLKKSYSWFIGWGIEEDNLPILYFTHERRMKFKPLLHPNSKLLIFIFTITLFIQFASPLFALFEVFFIRDEVVGDETEPNALLHERSIAAWISRIADYLEYFMYVHIIFQFITPFEFEDGIYCRDFTRIVFNYLSTPSRFLIDLFSSFPYKLMITPLSIARRLALFRLLRLIPFFRHLLSRHDDLQISAFRYKLSLSSTIALFSVHVMACFFFWVACPLNQPVSAHACRSDSWVVAYQTGIIKRIGGDASPEFFDFNILSRWYVRSFYWVISTVSSTGFGDIAPLNLREMGLCLITILFGVFGVSVIVGNISTGLASSLKAKREFDYNLKILVNHLKSVGLSQDGQDLMLSYYLSTWETSRGQPHHFSMSVLPVTMRCDVASAIYSPLIRTCKLFGGIQDFAFIRNVCVRLVHSQYLPGVNIVNNDEPGSSVYIVFKGEVASYMMDEAGELVFQKSYGPGDAFGKVPALFADMSYNKYYRSEGYSEVVALHQHDIRNIAFYFPAWRGFLVWIINSRYQEVVRQGKRHIFYIPPSELKEQMILEFAEVLARVKDDVDPLAFMYGEGEEDKEQHTTTTQMEDDDDEEVVVVQQEDNPADQKKNN